MKKKASGSSYLIVGILLNLIGIFILIGSVQLFKDITSIVLIIMILISIKDLFEFLLKKQEKNVKLFIKIISLILSVIAYIFKDYSIAIVPIIFSIYALINSLANLMNYTLLKINKLKGDIKNLIFGILYLFIGLIILFKPLIHLEFVLNIMGIYSLLLGISFVFDYLDFNHYRKFPRIRICLPSIIEVFIPISVLQKINRIIDNEEIKEDIKSNYSKTDLEILIHVTEDGYGKLGHLDICYKGEVISFGNYDINNSKLNGVFGNGVLFTLKDRNNYIKFCIEDSKKTLFVFGLKINKKEEIKIERNISKIKEQLKPWNPPYVDAKLKTKKVKKEDYMDYSSRIYRKLKPNFYQFKSSKYKVFFVLNNNCVALANKIIGSALKDSFKLYGVLTPGTYYDYLEKEYMKKNSIVISKKIYNKNNIDEL